MTLTLGASAQFSRYIVRFRDKGNNPYTIANPSQYLSQRAIQRRQRYNIAIDSTDLPVTPRYLDSLRAAGTVTILNTSKWLNQVAIKTSDAAAIAKINALPFVLSAAPIAPFAAAGSINDTKFGTTGNQDFLPGTSAPQDLMNVYNYGRSNGQVHIHQGEFLHNLGFRGEGMQLAILDGGFFHYLTLPTFDSIRNGNQILGTWDFVSNEASVNEDDKHGMHCLSTIAANMPGVFVGTAPKTSFYLYRTEDVATEYPVEEQNMAAGFEKADSAGADLCSVSLGYTEFQDPVFDYTYSDFDGNTTISAKAADLAAKKGMLLVIANGNEGTTAWHYLTTPADADSVLSVGAVDTLGNVAAFSGYGPSADGQVKPTLAAVGRNAIVASSSTGMPIYGDGTSFACPNLAGITTCLWQAFPEINNMGIIEAMKQSATRTANPDDRVGYGIPDVKRSFVYLIKKLFTQQVSSAGCMARIDLGVKAEDNMSVIIERKLAAETDYTVVSIQSGSGSFAMQHFNFTDDLSADSGGIAKYRFRMDISTDTTFYLDSVSVNMAGSCPPPVPVNNILIGPNPVTGDLHISVSRITAAKYEIQMHNAAGQRVYRSSGTQPAGTGDVVVPMQHLSSGVYYVTVLIDNKKTLVKEILKR
jgi:hypothetical protein